jgi:chromosome partitioning protein
MGFRVLVVDADPQGHLSTSFGFDSTQDHLTLYDVISEGRSLGEVIQNVYEGLDCVPANLSLTRIEVILNQMAKREEQITLNFKDYHDLYDFVLFDTNPTISHLNRNIITYADQVDIVCETQPYSLNGLSLLLDDIEKFYNSIRMKKADILVIPNKYEDRMATSGEAMSALRAHYMKLMKPDFAIRKSEDINISAKNGLPLAFFAKINSNALADIIEMVHYILSLSTIHKKKNEVSIGE